MVVPARITKLVADPRLTGWRPAGGVAVEVAEGVSVALCVAVEDGVAVPVRDAAGGIKSVDVEVSVGVEVGKGVSVALGEAVGDCVTVTV